MIQIRTTLEPTKVQTYSSRKEVQDLLHWGLVLEIVHDDEAVQDAEASTSLEAEVKSSDNPQTIVTREQFQESEESSKRPSKKSSSKKDGSD